MKIEPQEESKKILCCVFARVPLETLSLIPDKEYTQKKYPDLLMREGTIQEGGILDFYWYNENDENLTKRLKNQIVTVVGRGFKSKYDPDPEFSFSDARICHRLLFNKKCKDTVPCTIYYTYKDKETGLDMVVLAGVMLISKDVRMRQCGANKNKQLYTKYLSVCNLVMFTVLEEYRNRGLGLIAMQAMEGVMRHQKVDFVFWCGCNKQFYNVCGSDKNPKMIDCPFNIVEDEEENRSMFFYKVIGEDKFIEAVDKPSREFGDHFSIEYKNEALSEYYGWLEVNVNPNEGPVISEDGIISEQPKFEFDSDEKLGTTIVDIFIEDYCNDEEAYFKFQCVLGRGLIVFGVRPGHMSFTRRCAMQALSRRG